MAGEVQTEAMTVAAISPRHLSLAAASLGFLGSTFGLTVLMVLLGA